MKRKRSFLSQFLTRSAKMAGKPITFVAALAIVAAWFLAGLVFGFNDIWLLLINTVATLNAALRLSATALKKYTCILYRTISQSENLQESSLRIRFEAKLHPI